MVGDHVQVLGIIHHHTRVLATAFEHDLLEIALCRVLQKLAPDLRGSGKRDHVDVEVQPNGLAGGFTESSNNVQHPVW